LTQAPKLILASASPRRRELLAELGVPFEVRPADADERPLPGEKPEAMVIRLALAKARAAAGEGEIALGADTVVALGDEIFGKPSGAAEAAAMLERLSGRSHDVWTGVALVARSADAQRERACAERSRVVFHELAAEEIAGYVDSGEPLDRAGAYAIQGGAAGFVAGLEGSWSNVVGLPVERVRELLASFSRRT